MSLKSHILVWMALASMSSLAYSADKVTYKTDVKPILREHCFACHNQDDATASLALDSYEGLMAGGAGGEVLAAGDVDGSRFWKLVTHEEEPIMPPDSDKISEKQLQVLRAWIEGGLLKDAGSKSVKKRKSVIAKIDASKLGKPVGEPSMPEQLFHEPVLWTPRTGPVDAIATSPWAPLVAVAWQRQITFYHTDTHELLGILPYLDGVPRVVRFSRDGSLLLVAGGRHAAAGSATLFDVKTGARLVTLGDELDIVLAADISPDLSLVAIGGPKKKVRVYRVADGELAYQINKHTDWVTALGFSPNGRLLATADRSGGAQLWQAAAGHERADLRGHKGAITSLDWRADSAMLATASEDGTAKLWNPSGKQIKSVQAHTNGVLSVRFSRTGHWVTAGRDQKIKTWKSAGGAVTDFGKMPGMALAAAFSQDDTKIIASDYTGMVRVFNVKSKKQLATLQANPPRLAQRIANAEKHFHQTQQKHKTTKKHLATLLAALTQGQEAHATHDKKLAKTQAVLTAKRKKYAALTEEQNEEEYLAAEKSVQAAEATLAQVSNETAGLPDLAKLTEQHDQAQAELLAAEERLKKSEHAKVDVAAQLARFTKAADDFEKEAKQQQTDFAKLQAIQETLQEQQRKVATQLVELQTAMSESQQQVELQELRQRNFSAGEALRKTYAEAAE